LLAGIYVQQAGIGDISQVVVFGVGAMLLGENAGHLVYNSFFAPKVSRSTPAKEMKKGKRRILAERLNNV
jgi:hypothetical protein